VIPSLAHEEAVVTYLPHCFEILKRLGCSPPFLIGISLIGVRGLRLFDCLLARSAKCVSMGGSRTIDRDVILIGNVIMLSDIIFEHPSAPIAPLVFVAAG
jgi:hypothetical protein